MISSASLRRASMSRTTRTCGPCRLPPLGAKRALSRIVRSTASGSGSSVNSRTSDVVPITSYKTMCSLLPRSVAADYDPYGVAMKALLLENIHPTAAEILDSRGYEVDLRVGALPDDDLAYSLAGVSLLGIRSNTTVTARVLTAAP